MSLMKGLLILAPVLTIGPEIDIGKSSVLERPAGSYRKIIEWHDKEKNFCLLYKTPLVQKKEKHLGELFVVINREPGCSLGGVKEESLGDIEELKVQNISTNAGLRFELTVKTIKDHYHIKAEFPFFKKSNSRWKNIFPLVPEKKKSGEKLKRGDICIARDESCKIVDSVDCSQCPSGLWTPFIDLKCAQKISAQCGDYLCGAKGQKACTKMTALAKPQTCADILPFVYCQYGLEVECQSNGDVTCR